MVHCTVYIYLYPEWYTEMREIDRIKTEIRQINMRETEMKRQRLERQKRERQR